MDNKYRCPKHKECRTKKCPHRKPHDKMRIVCDSVMGGGRCPICVPVKE